MRDAPITLTASEVLALRNLTLGRGAVPEHVASAGKKLDAAVVYIQGESMDKTKCPGCGADVELDKEGKIKRHTRLVLPFRGGMIKSTTCAGSGRTPK